MVRGPAAAMSAEVSGEAEGVTLIEAIEAGRIPMPGELSFPLWRRVMEHLYGAGRAGEPDHGLTDVSTVWSLSL